MPGWGLLPKICGAMRRVADNFGNVITFSFGPPLPSALRGFVFGHSGGSISSQYGKCLILDMGSSITYNASMRKLLPLSEQIRRAVRDSGLSGYRISMDIDVSQATMSRFMNGLTGLSMEVMDRLGQLLQLEIKSNSNQ